MRRRSGFVVSVSIRWSMHAQVSLTCCAGAVFSGGDLEYSGGPHAPAVPEPSQEGEAPTGQTQDEEVGSLGMACSGSLGIERIELCVTCLISYR